MSSSPAPKGAGLASCRLPGGESPTEGGPSSPPPPFPKHGALRPRRLHCPAGQGHAAATDKGQPWNRGRVSAMRQLRALTLGQGQQPVTGPGDQPGPRTSSSSAATRRPSPSPGARRPPGVPRKAARWRASSDARSPGTQLPGGTVTRRRISSCCVRALASSACLAPGPAAAAGSESPSAGPSPCLPHAPPGKPTAQAGSGT